jgi:GNAT superfamily N-acetyltransferase
MKAQETQVKKLFYDVISGPGAQQELEGLLNRTFEVPRGASFYDDFPIWDERLGVPSLRIGAYADKRLVASASVRMAQLKAAKLPLEVALIGAVATEPEWRGHGLASNLASFATDWAQEQGAALAMLWGSEHSLYQRLGFKLAGMQIRVPLKKLIQGCSSELIIPKTGWRPSLMSCLQKRTGGLALGAGDEIWIASHKNVRWYWLGDDNAPCAYAAVGRGIDLSGLVHEWGGDRESLLKLLSGVERIEPGLELLGAPWLFDQYGFQYNDAPTEFLGLMRVLDFPKIMSAYDCDPVHAAKLINAKNIEQLLFGPSSHSAATLPGVPLPLWIWGLDAA